MRLLLTLLFTTILTAMLALTVFASMERSILEAGRDLLPDRWYQATLCDAYFGFITFYVWVAYKERAVWSRLVWFGLIMLLGNIAMASYMLIQLARLPAGAEFRDLLLPQPTARERA